MTVVVDFDAFGGGVAIRCAAERPSSGLEALSDAGFAVTMVTSMPGFVCRIDGEPASDPCATTPPPNAYWSYWTAQRGGAWTYSPGGAGGSRPADGTVEGWAFTDGSGAQPPSVAPPGYAATPRPTLAPTPRPTVRPTPRPALATPTQADAPSPIGATPAATAAASVGDTNDASAQPTEDPTPSPPATVPPDTRGSPTPTTEPAVSTTSVGGGGSPVGTMLGVGLVATIGAAALAVRRSPTRARD